jgi:hypothetical protein
VALINTREEYSRYSRYYVQLKQIYQEKPEVRASLELLLTLLTISFFIVFAIRPTANTIASLLSNINSQNEVKEKLDKKIADLSTARQVWSQEQNRLALIDDALPTNPAPDLYLRQIEGLAATHHSTITNYAIEQTTLYGKKPKLVQALESENPNKDTSGVSRTRIAFTISGQFSDLLNLMTDLETMRKIIQVDTLSISPKESGINKAAGDISLKVTAYTNYYETAKK